MKFMTELLWTFVLFGMVGWLCRAVPMAIKQKRLVNPGFINLPFLPSVGLSAVAVLLITYHMKNPWMMFFGSAILLTVVKYFVSMYFERVFKFKWRDYRNKKLTLNGYVSVWEPFAYGAAALLLKLLIFDWIRALALSMPLWLSILIPAVISGLILTDAILSLVVIARLRRNLRQMNDIYKLLHRKEGKLTNEQLRQAYEKKMLKSKHFRLRLVRAFPDMQSYDYEKQLLEMKDRLNGVKSRNDEVYEAKIENPEERPFAFGLSLTKLFWLFAVGSLFGTMMETVWALFAEGHFEMRVGVVWGPFIPVYGGGAVAITLCLYKLHKASDLVVYLASSVIGATFEYFCSYFQEMFLGTVSWDYSDTPFNIDGRTNLTFALIWGLLGLVWLRYIYPTFSRVIEKVPKKFGKIVTIIMVILLAFDGLCTMTAIHRYSERTKGVKAQSAIDELTDNVFNDDYMKFIFPHMTSDGIVKKQ